VAGGVQVAGEDGADLAGATGDENAHGDIGTERRG
jgi:hypothetical protein